MKSDAGSISPDHLACVIPFASAATAQLNAAASALHMSTADLQSALRSGKSLSALEAQQKVNDQERALNMQIASNGAAVARAITVRALI